MSDILEFTRHGDEFTGILRFVQEMEKLKLVYRQNMTVDRSRHENSAEHSWHVALMAILLADTSEAKSLDLLKVVKMLLIHDVVEIDAGDTFLYDAEANRDKDARESAAAARLFGLLPEKLAQELTELWREFEACQTPEAQYATALDSFQPLLNHWQSRGASITRHRLLKSQILHKKKHIAKGSPTLWQAAQEIIERSTALGLYLEG